MSRRVGLCGFGYWGKNLARCFNDLGVLKVIYDFNMVPRDRAREAYLHVDVRPTYDGIDFEGVDSIVVATPPQTHYDIARLALNAGKDVFIEKPMTTSSADAESLVKQARAQGRNLMVGHIYLHNEGIKRMPVPVGKAELYVQLLNEGGAPSESTRDMAWAGLPHACSLALHFFPDWPDVIEAEIDGDRIKACLRYWNGSEAYLDVGDNTGRKLRRVELRIQNSRYLFDVARHEGVTLISGTDITSFGFGQDQKEVEPLKVECKAFLEYQGVDLMGPKVVKLIEEILDGCDP